MLKEAAFGIKILLKIDAVPPPLFPPLVENKKLKFGGQASVRTTDPSVLSHVSVKNKQSKLLSKIRSLMIKDLFDRERTFKSANLRVADGLFNGAARPRGRSSS